MILPIEYAGTLWFLAVNRSAQAASCRIELPQPISALHELRENRAITLSNGGFHESFPAWGTHLYDTGDMLPPIHTAPPPVPQWDAEGAPWLQPAEK